MKITTALKAVKNQPPMNRLNCMTTALSMLVPFSSIFRQNPTHEPKLSIYMYNY